MLEGGVGHREGNAETARKSFFFQRIDRLSSRCRILNHPSSRGVLIPLCSCLSFGKDDGILPCFHRISHAELLRVSYEGSPSFLLLFSRDPLLQLYNLDKYLGCGKFAEGGDAEKWGVGRLSLCWFCCSRYSEYSGVC